MWLDFRCVLSVFLKRTRAIITVMCMRKTRVVTTTQTCKMRTVGIALNYGITSCHDSLKLWKLGCHDSSNYRNLGLLCDIPHRKRTSRARALWVVLVADLLYVFWDARLRSGLALPRTKPWERKGRSGQYTAGWAGLLHLVSKPRMARLKVGDCDIPHRKQASRARALWVVLVADLLYAFWNVRLRSGLALPRTKSWGR
jgi:hypothetical protein